MNYGEPGAAPNRVGAGTRALAVFAHPLNGKVLRAHASHSLGSHELAEILRWVPEASQRLAVNDLRKLGALVRLQPTGEARFPTSELTPAGRGLLTVADALESWLLRSPSGPIGLDDTAGSAAIKALIAGWDSTMVRELAERPLTQTELSTRIASHNYPALGRRLVKLRSTSLLIPGTARGDGVPHEVSDWLRRGVAPLIVASRWERTHTLAEVGPATRAIDVEAAFLLIAPLIHLEPEIAGSCDLAVLMSEHEGPEAQREAAGVSIGVKSGEIVSCIANAEFTPATWAMGAPTAWHEALIDGDLSSLRFGGMNPRLPELVVGKIHQALFPA